MTDAEPRVYLCPACGIPLVGHEPQFAAPPDPGPGDLSVCAHCGAVLEIRPAGILTLLEEAAFVALSPKTRGQLLDAVHRVRLRLRGRLPA